MTLLDRAVFSGWQHSRPCVLERKETNTDRKKVRAERHQCHASREEGWDIMKMIFKALLPADLHPPMEQSKEIPVSRLLNQLPNQTSSYMLKIWKQQKKISNLGSCKESKSVLVKNPVQDFPGGPGGRNPPANVGNTGPGRFRLPLSNSTCELPLLKSAGSRASKPQRPRPHAAPPEARACAPSRRSAIKGPSATVRGNPCSSKPEKALKPCNEDPVQP